MSVGASDDGIERELLTPAPRRVERRPPPAGVSAWQLWKTNRFDNAAVATWAVFLTLSLWLLSYPIQATLVLQSPTVTRGRITDITVDTYDNHLVTYRYRVGRHDYEAVDNVKSDYADTLFLGKKVRVRYFAPTPQWNTVLADSGAGNNDIGSWYFLSILWNGFLGICAVLAWRNQREPVSEKRFVKYGVAVRGTVRAISDFPTVPIPREARLILYSYDVPDSGNGPPVQHFGAKMSEVSEIESCGIRHRHELTVLYLPAQPYKSLLYGLSRFRARG